MRLINNLVKSQSLLKNTINYNFVRFYSDEAAVDKILTQLKADLKASMKARDKFRSGVIRGILSDINYAEMASAPGTKFLKDSEIAPLLFKAVERRKDSIEQYKAGNRSDLVEVEETEIQVIQTYLPQPLTEEEILSEIKKVGEELGLKSVKDMGKLMANLKLDATRAPKATIAKIAKNYLQSL